MPGGPRDWPRDWPRNLSRDWGTRTEVGATWASQRALWASSEALCRSSGACCASHGPFGSVLGSISRPSRPPNLCSRRGESIDFRKSAFPRSIFILGSKSPLKVTSWTPKWRSRRVLSAPRALQDALRDAFWPSRGVSWGALGCPWAFWSAQGLPGGTPAPLWEVFWKDLGWISRSVRQRKKAFTTSLHSKNDIVSPYKRYKMLCADAVQITIRRHRDTHCNQDTGQWALWRGRRAAH